MYPLLSWIGVLLDLGCLEGGGLDIAWVSELDPAWLDDELSFLLNPEAALFANLPAQAACAADCAAASVGLPLDPMFWCAGCQGGMYPLTRHGLDVLAVSLTGEALEGWPEAVSDNGRAARLGLGGGPGRSPAPVPALVLFDTVTKRVVPVGFGVMAEDEMAERIFALTALEPGHDY